MLALIFPWTSARSLFGSVPSINCNHFGKQKSKSHCPTQSLSSSPWPYLWSSSPLFPHLTPGAYTMVGLPFKVQPCSSQNNGSIKDVLVGIPRPCEYVRSYNAMDWIVYPLKFVFEVCNTDVINRYLVFVPSSWHRAPKTLVISWVIGTSFVVIFGLSPQFLTQELLRTLESAEW